jgi:hypothetical protein
MSDGLESAIAQAERRVRALKRQIARDERSIEKALARAARAEANVERWWFGKGGPERLLVSLGATMRRAFSRLRATAAAAWTGVRRST